MAPPPPTLTGLLIAIQNWALCLAPVAVGELRDASGGFGSVLALFLALNVACIVVAAVLWTTSAPITKKQLADPTPSPPPSPLADVETGGCGLTQDADANAAPPPSPSGVEGKKDT